jgi:hypothetical protein
MKKFIFPLILSLLGAYDASATVKGTVQVSARDSSQVKFPISGLTASKKNELISKAKAKCESQIPRAIKVSVPSICRTGNYVVLSSSKIEDPKFGPKTKVDTEVDTEVDRISELGEVTEKNAFEILGIDKNTDSIDKATKAFNAIMAKLDCEKATSDEKATSHEKATSDEKATSHEKATPYEKCVAAHDRISEAWVKVQEIVDPNIGPKTKETYFLDNFSGKDALKKEIARVIEDSKDLMGIINTNYCEVLALKTGCSKDEVENVSKKWGNVDCSKQNEEIIKLCDEAKSYIEKAVVQANEDQGEKK